MPISHPIYRDIYIDKGANFSQIIELSIPFDDYDFEGSVKSSYTSLTAIPITFAAVTNEPKKVELSITAENTRSLRRLRGIYDIFATNKETGEIHKEREGTAFYNNSVSADPGPLPAPPDYQIVLADVTDAGTAAASDVEDFAAAEHEHGNITTDGKIGSTTGLPLKTGIGGIIETGSFGSTEGTFTEGDDARLSDAREIKSGTYDDPLIIIDGGLL